MKYTLTVWVDFEAETREEALEITDEMKAAVKRALRDMGATQIDMEWTPDDPALRTLTPDADARRALAWANRIEET